ERAALGDGQAQHAAFRVAVDERGGAAVEVARPHEHARAGAGQRRAGGSRGQVGPDGVEQRRWTVRLVQPVLEREREPLGAARGEPRAEQHRVGGREGAVRVRDLGGQRVARVLREHALGRHDGDRLQRQRLRDLGDAPPPGDAGAARERRPEVVLVALEAAAQREQLRRGAALARGRETERDRRRGRAETALERDAVDEAEALACRRLQQRVGAHGQVRLVLGQLAGALPLHGHGHAAGDAVDDLELVPEVERDGGAVEAGAEVGRGGGRPHLHRAAAAIASGSGSTIVWPGAYASALAGSLRPCPVIVQTTTSPSTAPAATAATPAAEDGSQNSPSSAANSRQAATIWVSSSETTVAPARATSSAWTGAAMRMALASVRRRSLASAETSRASTPSSAIPRAYAVVLPPPP